MARIRIRKGMPDVQLTKAQFTERFRDKFFDPIYRPLDDEIAKVIEVAWVAYDDYHKNPVKRRAGDQFSKSDAMLPEEWLDTHTAITAAEKEQKSPDSRPRVLLINGSARSDQSCPGEMSKSWRLVEMAKAVFDGESDIETDVLDLSRLTSEYGRNIYPCKACVSTAQPLCHWPCSCYPNFAMGQVNDWMSEIYPMWVRAHGVMIVTPVNWYQAPGPLKLMIDRLVCADGGNPDPTTTGGKDPKLAKQLELKGWPYPRHLAGRVFSVVVHGDAAGVENLRRILCDWLGDLGLVQAGHRGVIGAYVGYLGSYAESHDDLDRDTGFQEDTRTAARALVAAVRLLRAGKLTQPDAGLHEARPK